MKKPLSALALAAVLLPLAGAAHAAYPERAIHATIPWGAGGLTDLVARTLIPLAEDELGVSIVPHNRPGGGAVIGVNYVRQQRPNGYNLLVGTQDTTLYPVLGVADFAYEDFTPINVIGQGLVVIAVHPDSPHDSLGDLLAAIEAAPGSIRMGDVGAGATPHITHTILDAVTDYDLDVRKVTFGGDGPGITALMGQHIDFMPLSLPPAVEYLKSGRLKGLAILAAERIDLLPEIPAVTEDLPEAEAYLPWGSFQGIYVHKDTPEAIKATLADAFEAAVGSEAFTARYNSDFGGVTLNLRGDEAQAYIDRWQALTSWLLEDAGAAKVSPESLGIARP
ncbi:tripartite tricarboxylate transporter substrate binding protein [Halomonas daqingensis]|uniref:Tripartite tricarboxylate transporter substrate binding protein n=1 Tax=Billgrantia desiderata TaxID=52021 RepID=A0ABS9B8U1_9GAMM|nr:tripartite tricarboxylate transporter substrate binding protein [Halomonas desiderata]MCE8043973.1 tripartite tricarboxylate transporter substrate binding protein [Halomonas desiderata]MCE8048547.1 tripartite tricarboxylate transporter substrate binding protein [Halomonas desiderata]